MTEEIEVTKFDGPLFVKVYLGTLVIGVTILLGLAAALIAN